MVVYYIIDFDYMSVEGSIGLDLVVLEYFLWIQGYIK